MEHSLTEIAWRLAGVLALVFANGFFVAAEFAIVTVRKTRIDQLIAEGHRGARAVRRAVTPPHSPSTPSASTWDTAARSLGARPPLFPGAGLSTMLGVSRASTTARTKVRSFSQRTRADVFLASCGAAGATLGKGTPVGVRARLRMYLFAGAIHFRNSQNHLLWWATARWAS